MRMKPQARGLVAIAAATMVLAIGVNAGHAASAGEISSSARSALSTLYAHNASAKMLGQKARGILVFPSILKAGFIVGGQGGDGAMFKRGKTAGYYRTVAASYGLQVGAQKFGYALFFMNDAALQQLDKTGGFELGVGPSFVVVDEGMGKSITTNTIASDVYAYIFNQKGLMGGLGIQGSKITRIHPE
jgi:lipid-binding SYLF domain-containing protein